MPRASKLKAARSDPIHWRTGHRQNGVATAGLVIHHVLWRRVGGLGVSLQFAHFRLYVDELEGIGFHACDLVLHTLDVILYTSDQLGYVVGCLVLFYVIRDGRERSQPAIAHHHGRRPASQKLYAI